MQEMAETGKVSVIGAGTMGNGIAHVFASRGWDVVLVDVSTHALEMARSTIAANMDRQIKKELISPDEKEAALDRIESNTDLSTIEGSDLVVEAATEDRDLKLKIFREIAEQAEPTAILATNTSSISITEIAAVAQHPDRVVGMHFMNPVPVMELVEVIRGLHTSD